MKSFSSVFLACLLAVGLFADPRNSKQASKANPAERATAAQQAGVSAAEFEKASRANKHLHLDRGKRPLFACEGLAAQVGPDTSGYTSTALYPLADTFTLHSRPGAAKVIYLDFTGHTTANTPWNSGVNASANIATPAFDLDGDPTTFNDAERAAIQDVWRRVSEDYAPFDVDVTTADPGIEAIRRTSYADSRYGVRCVIGGSSMDWLGSPAGGVAYVGTFNSVVSASLTDNDIPAFVFPAQLGNNARLIAEAASHEVGHTLGLYHSGQTTGVEYYAGHSDWAPIMGASYYKSVTQWTKGDYPLSNNSQDQLAIIGAKLGRVASSHGGDASSASVVPDNALSAGGIIVSGSRQDWYKLSVGAGALSVSGAVAQPSANLKLALTLVDSTGAIVAQGASNGMGSNLSATVSDGDYYLVVDGVGSTNDPATGYTDYGSLGRYGLAGTWPAATSTPPPPQPPVVPNVPPVASTLGSTPLVGVAPLSVRLDGSASLDVDGSIVSYRWEFGDGSVAATTAVANHVYAAGTYTARLSVTDDAGATSSATVQVVVSAAPTPPPPPPVTTGSCHISSIDMSWVKVSAGTGYVQGVVTVVDDSGKPVSGATVSVKATGLVKGVGVGRTNFKGQLTLITGRLPASLKGDVTFTVTGVAHAKLTYASAQNVVSSATLSLVGSSPVVRPPSYRPHDDDGDNDDHGHR